MYHIDPYPPTPNSLSKSSAVAVIPKIPRPLTRALPTIDFISIKGLYDIF